MNHNARRRYQRHYAARGHVWQGRFKAIPIEQDEHLLAVLRYVERNALRAGLVGRAQDWPYSSLYTGSVLRLALDPGPVARPADWVEVVNAAAGPAEEEAVRECLRRGRPFGGDAWTNETAARLGLGRKPPPRRPAAKVSAGGPAVALLTVGARTAESVDVPFVWSPLFGRTSRGTGRRA